MRVSMVLVTKPKQILVGLMAGEGVLVAEMVQLDPARGPAGSTDSGPSALIASFAVLPLGES